ncbi:MAG: MlaD family protein [Candidatus Dadabacteria bacterium]|nr:MlaD family protein [Candidatus Dadabacteria bacterium]MCY4262607.1 MlaD family protein [Candidatus Dadabacteria bacterium]
MKKERSAQLKVGIFVLVSIAIFVYGVFTISGQEELFEKEYEVKTYFNNSAGLLEGAYVRLSGVGVGSVSSIRFSDDPSMGKVQVVMKINKPSLQRVSKDSHATIKTEGLLGAKFVEIVPGSGESIGKARDGIVIRGYTSPEMQEIISQSEEFVTNLTTISRNLDKIVEAFADEANPGNARNTLLAMQESFQTISATIQAIEKNEGFLHTLIYDDQFAADMRSFSSNLAEVSRMIRHGEGSLGALVVDPSVHDSLKGVLGEAERNRFVRSAVKYMIEEKEKKASERR